MEQHDLPLSDAFAGHQRRAVGELRDHPRGQRRVGLRHDLRGHGHVVGNRQAEERAVLGEGGERFRLAPAHGAADAAPTGAQAHRHQRVFLAAADIACGKARTGKAQQRAARLEPFEHAGLFARRQRGDIGQHDHVGVRGQHLFERAVEQVCGGLERAVEEVQRREQFEPLAVLVACDQCHLAAAQAVIGQGHRAGAAGAFDLEPGDPRPQFGGQVQLELGLGGGLLEAHRVAHQHRRVARRIEPVPGDGDFGLGAGAQTLQGETDMSILEAGRGQRVMGARAFEHGHLAARFQRREQRRAVVAGEPVGHPVAVEILFGQHLDGARDARLVGLPRLGQNAGQARLQHAGGLELRLFGRREAQQGHRARLALGAGEQGVERCLPLAPVRGAGPAGIHHHQKRARARLGAALLLRVQHRPGEADDHRGDGEHPHEQQPPRRAVGDLLFILQAEQQHHAGKHPADRRRRHRAQDDPQHRQRQKPEQQPGRGKPEGAEHGHPWPPSIARYTHSSADCALSEV